MLDDVMYIIKKEPFPYTFINKYVVLNMKHIVSGGIYCYLKSLVENEHYNTMCIVNELSDHFKMDTEEIKKIFSYLKRCFLIDYEEVKDNKSFKVKYLKVLSGESFDPNVKFKEE